MHKQIILFLGCLFLAGAALGATDIYLSIGGTVNNFHTDARIFNPSTTTDIQVQAYFLPVASCSNGTCTGDNSGVQPMTITIPKRQMVVYDDIVTSLFHTTGLGGVRLTSSGTFIATQRIYALTAAGTLGQFVAGLDAAQAQKNGVLIQLKSNASFRTNIGVVNPNATAANVTFYLYDKNNNLVASGSNITMPPFSVISPTNMAGGFFFNAGSADISDSWIAYTSDQPLFAYGSVVDNGTTDPTYIPAAADAGNTTVYTPPQQGTSFNIVEVDGKITITPDPNTIQPNATVTFNIVNNTSSSQHGFTLQDPNGNTIIQPQIIPNQAAPVVITWKASTQGTYYYTCSNNMCSNYHNTMNGTFNVGAATNNPYPHY